MFFYTSYPLKTTTEVKVAKMLTEGTFENIDIFNFLKSNFLVF